MKVQSIKGQNFKNYDQINLELSSTCNVIHGENGMGKTNFLDLIHFASLGKSYFSITDKQAIKKEKDYFRIEVKFKSDEDEEIITAVSVPQIGKKRIWVNGTTLKKNTEILGLVPIVCIVPDDTDLIRGSSIVRRKFMDKILCQINPAYTNALISYEKTLKLKLSLLKNSSSISELDYTLLQTYDQWLFQYGTLIFNCRSEFCETFAPQCNEMYSEISSTEEMAQIQYSSNFNQDTFLEESKANWELDFYTKRVRKGLHRDDISFLINNSDVRKFASQGQKKTFVYALKFSEYLFLSSRSNKTPLMLLDDVFEKLDRNRLKHLFKVLTSSIFGQIFISDTEEERASAILKELDISFKSFIVENNTIFNSNG